MLALLAAIVFFLGLVGISLGSLNLMYLGLMLMALHLALGSPWPVGGFLHRGA